MKNELRIDALSAAARDPKFNPHQFGFPLRVVVDNVGLTISHSSRLKKGRPYESYTVCYRDQERRRKRVPKADFNEAVKVAVKVAGAINAGQMDTLALHNDDKRAYLQAVEMLKPLGVRLEIAVAGCTAPSLRLVARPDGRLDCGVHCANREASDRASGGSRPETGSPEAGSGSVPPRGAVLN